MQTAKREAPVTDSLRAMLEPTYVCSHTQGSVTIDTRLFGLVTVERMEQAQRETARRADMLQPYIPPMEDDKIFRRPRPESRRGFRDDYDDEGDFIGDFDNDEDRPSRRGSRNAR